MHGWMERRNSWMGGLMHGLIEREIMEDGIDGWTDR